MTDGDRGIPGKVSPRHLKPAKAGGGWVTATDQEKRAAHQREEKCLTKRRRQPKLGVWGAVKRHVGANCVCTRNSPGWGGLEPNSGPSHGCTPKAHHLLSTGKRLLHPEH